MVAKGRRKSAVEVMVGTFYYSGTNLDLIPGINNIPSRPLCALEIFVVMEIEMSVHLHRFRDARSYEVIGAAAASAECEIGIRRIDDASKIHVAAKIQTGVSGQSEINKISRVSAPVGDLIPR